MQLNCKSARKSRRLLKFLQASCKSNPRLSKVLKIQAERNRGGGLSILSRGAQDSFDESGYSPDPVSILRTIDVVFELVD